MVIDAWNFSAEELKTWAYREPRTVPDQDWELSIANSGFDALVMDLAEDAECPNRKFMISCLYMMVGDLLHCELSEKRKSEVLILVNRGELSGKSDVVNWANKAKHVIANPSTFEYKEWCWVPSDAV